MNYVASAINNAFSTIGNKMSNAISLTLWSIRANVN
jgi:hypothetical protein